MITLAAFTEVVMCRQPLMVFWSKSGSNMQWIVKIKHRQQNDMIDMKPFRRARSQMVYDCLVINAILFGGHDFASGRIFPERNVQQCPQLFFGTECRVRPGAVSHILPILDAQPFLVFLTVLFVVLSPKFFSVFAFSICFDCLWVLCSPFLHVFPCVFNLLL